MAFTQDFRTQRRNFNDGETRVGEKDRLWYDSNTNTIRISDGVTPGGIVVGGDSGGGNYVLPTASTTVRGGVRIDGTTITINNGVISATQPDLSSYATQAFVTTRGYLTSVGTISYNDLSNKPTLFSGSYTDLTNKPTIPTTVTVNGTSITLDSSGSLNSLINGSDTLSLDGASKVNLPGGTASIFAAANVIALTSDASGNNYFEIANNVGVSLYTNRGFELRTNKGSTDRIWSFNQSGSLTFPDDTIQTTAYTATAAKGLFSAANNSASGSGGSLSYTNGVYTFTPALNITGNAATVTNGVYTTDTGTVTNTMLAGSIANNKLTNSSVTINGTSVSLGSSATVTAAAGTLTGSTLASGVTASSLTSLGTLTGLTSTGSVTANNATAFIAGDNAISNVALQMPSESALRNLTNGSTNMYFDVSIGGSGQGQFQFRSTSSYTNVLTMSTTGVTFNTDATFTSRTPSLARTAYNAAIDTEITVDNMRFRVSNQGGVFPQVIGNGSSRNLAWTGVGAINGTAVNQAGSTGTIVASNAWTTLYNLHGMDSAGDTVTVTLQDKAAGRIYRITFMRSDNGSTTGYNIIGERIL